MYYLAYGSNMDEDQMSHRCPGAKLIGTGRLHGFQLEFNRHATIVESENPDSLVPVAVWKITPDDELRLDRYEGYPTYYRKISCGFDVGEEGESPGMVYQMCNYERNPPDGFYYKSIKDAYENLGFHDEIKRVLQPALMRSYHKTRR